MAAERVVLEMTIDRDDFLRRLPQAVGDFVEDGDAIQAVDQRWRLRITPLPGGRLGLLDLERLRVEFDFPGFGPAEREAFLARFRLHYHRGGG